MKKRRVALIGCGMICNSAHFPALDILAAEGLVEVVAVADIRPDAARETAERHHVKAWYADPQEMLDKEKPDFVAVCTPNVYHKQWTIAALRAGADVACEKPIATSLKDAEEMWAVAEETGRHLFPCQCMRWRNYMMQSHELVQNGELGTPYFADVSFIRRIGIPTWGMFHMKEENGGGPFCDLGVHFLDSFLWMCGNPRVEAVSGNTYDIIAKKGEEVLLNIAESGAPGGTFTPRPYDHKEFSVEDSAVGSMRIAGNISVNFKFTWCMHQPTAKHIVICGDKGGLSVNGETLYKNVGRYQSEMKMKWFDNGAYKGAPFEQHRYMYRHMMDVLEGKAEYLIRKEQNLEVTKAIECFYRSAELGREVRAEQLAHYQK